MNGERGGGEGEFFFFQKIRDLFRSNRCCELCKLCYVFRDKIMEEREGG